MNVINFKSPLTVFKQKNFVQIQKVNGATATLSEVRASYKSRVDIHRVDEIRMAGILKL